MGYTVKKLAALSGVSVRTLHWYDEVGLLKPAYHGANGYRYYEEAQFLKLQQILFYRELGFELQEIKRLLGRSDFDLVTALKSHRRVLNQNLDRTRELIATIDKTLAHLKGTKAMKTQEMFAGFSPEQQAKHEQYLVRRFGKGAERHIAESKARVKDWTKEQWAKSQQQFVEICQELTRWLEAGRAEESGEVQAVVRRHFEWLKQFWTPTKESYAGHSHLIEDSELSQAYAVYHRELPGFMAAAVRVFAERELGGGE